MSMLLRKSETTSITHSQSLLGYKRGRERKEERARKEKGKKEKIWDYRERKKK